MRLLKLLLAMTAIASATPALAQDDTVAGEDIVVTQTRDREIQQMALAVTAPGNVQHEPIAQFQQKICPGVVGTKAEFAAEIVARIRSVIGAAGIDLAAERCKPNLLVMFLPNGQEAMRSLLVKHSWPFSDVAPEGLKDLAADPVLKDLARDPGPVHVWTNTQDRTRYGAFLTGRGDAVEPPVAKMAGSASRLYMGARRDIMGSLIVIDTPATTDMTATQIADFAVMRGLMRTRSPGKAAKVGTILSLFDDGAALAPLEMTEFDQAYLRAAYNTGDTVPLVHLVGQVAGDMKKARDKE